MPKDQATDRQDRKDRETRGGYPAGGKQVSDFRPPPPGPAPGGKRPDEQAEPSRTTDTR
jgi:hypothetical protein